MKECIVVFDSGMGGITALIKAMEMLPQENFIFYGDNKNVPYGTKSYEEIQKLMDRVIEDITPFNPKALVLACNTATVSSAEYLRKKYKLPIIGMEPAIKPALIDPKDQDKRVLLLATEATSHSKKLSQLISNVDKESRVDILPMPSLVHFAENLQFDGPELMEDIHCLLSSYDFNDYKAVVLGCTHFIWYIDFFHKILPPHIQLVDGNVGTIRQLSRRIVPTSGQEKGSVSIYFTKTITPEKKKFLEEAIPRKIQWLDSNSMK